MKLRPILFSTPMVLALLAGDKTQTRRKIKPQPIDNTEVDGNFFAGDHSGYVKVDGHPHWRDQFVYQFAPYEVGDVLWVRETWAITTNINKQEDWPDRPHLILDPGDPDQVVIYRADGFWQWLDDDGFTTERSFWKPSIFMPYAACRIWLEVVSVRLERLQDISEADAVAEGVYCYAQDDPTQTDYKNYLHKGDDDWGFVTAKQSYQSLWDSINGKGAWDENPYVWVIEFKRVEKPA